MHAWRSSLLYDDERALNSALSTSNCHVPIARAIVNLKSGINRGLDTAKDENSLRHVVPRAVPPAVMPDE
jgi:hypothetical protein